MPLDLLFRVEVGQLTARGQRIAQLRLQLDPDVLINDEHLRHLDDVELDTPAPLTVPSYHPAQVFRDRLGQDVLTVLDAIVHVHVGNDAPQLAQTNVGHQPLDVVVSFAAGKIEQVGAGRSVDHAVDRDSFQAQGNAVFGFLGHLKAGLLFGAGNGHPSGSRQEPFGCGGAEIPHFAFPAHHQELIGPRGNQFQHRYLLI